MFTSPCINRCWYFRHFAVAALLGGAVLALPAPSLAQCSNNSNNTVTTCTGNLSGGVQINGPVELIVQSLSGNIGSPSSTFNGVSLINNGASQGGGQNGDDGGFATIDYDGAPFEILTQNVGILAGAVGGNGGSGNPAGGDGGTGGGGIALNFLSGSVLTDGEDSLALWAYSLGGNGGIGGNVGGFFHSGRQVGGAGGDGGDAGTVAINVTQGAFTQGGTDPSFGGTGVILAESQGGDGVAGGEGTAYFNVGQGGAGGAGGSGESTAINLGAVTINMTGGTGAAVLAQSFGAEGGSGGEGWSDVADGDGGAGGAGGAGGNITIISGSTGFPGALQITTAQAQQHGVQANSVAGAGGMGGFGDASGGSAGKGYGGNGGQGGSGGTVSINLAGASIETAGQEALGVFARSYGGAGGAGGSGNGASGRGGSGAGSGPGGQVDVTFSGTLATAGQDANGLFAQSVGGFSGSGGAAAGFVAYGAGSESAGAGGDVHLDTQGATSSIKTTGDWASGLTAQSVGGGGGKGSAATGIVAIGGTGSAGGDGGTVTIANAAGVTTAGQGASALSAASHGGGGGDGGGAGGIVGIGGSSGQGGTGGQVDVSNSGALVTGGTQADGIHASSVGGGGGSAHSTGGLVAIGGSGGNGGNGGIVALLNGGGVATSGADADGVFIQSIGGGGGAGSNAISVSALFSLAIGGTGGGGGDGMAASYTDAGVNNNYTIATQGDRARGLFVQSVGGGGGDGGNAIAASASPTFDISIGASGSGGNGGSGGAASATLGGGVTTSGDLSSAVIVRSVGGGGGASGTTVSAAEGAVVSVNVAVGGSGGKGGSAGATSATSTGALATFGVLSHGLVAHSVGGGGGAAGTTVAASGASAVSITNGIGGKGGVAGDGGTVQTTTSGSIQTGGHGAVGLSAMSIGGGGGDGGTTVSANAVSAGSITVGVGGSGGASGAGGAVTVNNTATIATKGAISEGILAHSIARGGGSSGVVAAANGVTIGGINVAVGGSGGSGGASGDVNVTSQGGVSTGGILSNAIDAQSIAGGGGKAKGSISASALSMGNIGISVGGSGGGGGNAGKVAVSSNGALATTGDLSHAIVAQSLGGGGGAGGYAAEGSFTAGEVSGQMSAEVGGQGGNGGNAGTVGVTTEGTISTTGYWSTGIVGQSIGGSGGMGGSVYSGNLAASSTGSLQVNLGLGGDGGDGGVGNAVQIDNAADIKTQSYFASGILAQSIGGAGGSGGNVYTVVAAITPGSDININGSVGGAGGTGNHAGTATVTNTGTITTLEGAATAIHVASIGGGGGRAGNAANINIDLTGGGNGSSVNAAFGLNVGGAGGAGGDGNAVTVTNEAALATSGASARGIFAQSVGGGGGDGGTASSDSIGFNGTCKLVTGGNQYLCSTADAPDDVTQVSASLTIEIGGSGGAAGDGEAVNVSNSSTITTTGRLAHAIMAHSIGGGGGTGGEGDLGIAGWTTNSLAQALDSLGELYTGISDFTNVGIGVGGSGGAAGTGGTVAVTNPGTLTTSGDHAFGIHAQSVGGGGGNGGAGSTGLTPNITVGGAGSGGGDGGAVTVIDDGAINTSGRGAIGIFAQSVGGGGGTAGDVEMGLTTEHLNIGVGVGVQRSAGAGGDGGVVDVRSGAITTTGYAAHGIFAHSVGGSGGAAGISGVFEGGPTSFVGSVGDRGNAGAVSINVDGAIAVSGEDAHALFAQSASGKSAGDTSGDVTINVYQDVSATGLDGRGILAQSASVDNAQNGTIAIYVGPFQGNTNVPVVTTGAEGNETVYLWGGANNLITNAGTLTQLNTSSYVIRTDAVATTTVDNTGTINGSVLGATVTANPLLAEGGVNNFVFAGPSSIDVLNRAGGTLNAGQLLDVRNLDNQGFLTVGTANQIGTTRLTGDLVQGESGVLSVDLNPRLQLTSEQADKLIIDGSASLGGKVVVNLLDTWQALPGEQSLAILTAEGGLALGEQPLTQSAVAQYQLVQPSAEELHLTYDIDFANQGIMAQTNDNQDDIARYIHGIYRAGALDSAVAQELIAIENTADYAQVMNSLSAEIAVDNQTASLLSGIRFNDALLSCAQRSGQYRFYDHGQCGWLRANGQSFNQQDTDDNLGFEENSWQFAGGGQIDLRNDWYLGGALSYERSNLNVDDSNARSDGDRFQLGVSAKHRFHATELSGSVAAGYGSFDINRNPAAGVSIDGNQDLWLYSGQLRAAQLFDYQRWSIKPRIDLGVDYLSADGYNENGNSDFRLRIDGENDTYVHLQPAIDIATEFNTDDGMLIRPRFTLGVTQFLGDAAPEVTGRFAGAPSTVTPFTASTDLDKTRVEIAAGVDVFALSNLVVRAEVFGSVSDNSDSYGGGVKVAMPF
jgi:hypothetical protein